MKTVDEEWLDFLAAVSNGNVDFVARFAGVKASNQKFDALTTLSPSGFSGVSKATENLAGLSESSGSHYTRGL